MSKPNAREQDLFLDAPLWDEGLTGRQRRFVEAYCTDKQCFLNAAAAFEKAYAAGKNTPARSSLKSNPARLMRNPKIKDAIARLLRSKQNEEDVIAEYQVLKLLNLLTFYNPAEIIDQYGGLRKSPEDLGDLALCIAGIKTGKDSREVKLFDRTKALSMLAEYLKLIRPQEGRGPAMPIVILSRKEYEEAEYELMEAAEK
jgi:phage terminase small subunit